MIWLILGAVALVAVIAFVVWLFSGPEPVWVVDNNDWPARSSDDPELDPEEVLAVLDEFTRYYPAAVASLADTATPTEEERP